MTNKPAMLRSSRLVFLRGRSTCVQLKEAEELHKEGKFKEAIASLGADIEENAPALIKRSRLYTFSRESRAPACGLFSKYQSFDRKYRIIAHHSDIVSLIF